MKQLIRTIGTSMIAGAVLAFVIAIPWISTGFL